MPYPDIFDSDSMISSLLPLVCVLWTGPARDFRPKTGCKTSSCVFGPHFFLYTIVALPNCTCTGCHYKKQKVSHSSKAHLITKFQNIDGKQGLPQEPSVNWRQNIPFSAVQPLLFPTQRQTTSQLVAGVSRANKLKMTWL